MKKFVITDPCYLVGDSGVWSEVCHSLDYEKEVQPKAEEILSAHLGTKVEMRDTYAGDWRCYMYSHDAPERILSANFCADAAMVCFCEVNDNVEKALSKLKPWTYALIECENPICEFSRKRLGSTFGNTVLTLRDGGKTFKSLICDDIDEDDLDY